MFIVKTKKEIMGLALILFIGITSGVIINISPIKGVFSINKNIKTIIIDAGHGLPDGGTTGNAGTVEQEINLQIAKKTEEVLNGKGYRIIMTRTSNESLAMDDNSTIRKMKLEDMKKRKELIKKSGADLFISIHMNSYPNEKVSGLRFFYSEKHPKTLQLAEQIQNEIGKITGAKTYAVKTADKDLFLMKNIPVPAILAECGFLSNPEEEQKLKDKEYQSKIAWAIAKAIDDYYN